MTAVVSGCVALLEGRDTDLGLIVMLGGPGVVGAERRAWWPVVLAAGMGCAGIALRLERRRIGRGHGRAERRRVAGREMALKVVARHQVGDATAAVAQLRYDRVVRVAAAADRTLAALTADVA